MAALATLIAFTNVMDHLWATEFPDGVNNLNFLDFDHEFWKIFTSTAIEELGPYGLLLFVIPDAAWATLDGNSLPGNLNRLT
jgi:hypothetical protein